MSRLLLHNKTSGRRAVLSTALRSATTGLKVSECWADGSPHKPLPRWWRRKTSPVKATVGMLAGQRGRRQEELDRMAEDGTEANRNMRIPLSVSVFKDKMFLLPTIKQDVFSYVEAISVFSRSDSSSFSIKEVVHMKSVDSKCWGERSTIYFIFFLHQARNNVLYQALTTRG